MRPTRRVHERGAAAWGRDGEKDFHRHARSVRRGRRWGWGRGAQCAEGIELEGGRRGGRII
jgi:hypothetical protein